MPEPVEVTPQARHPAAQGQPSSPGSESSKSSPKKRVAGADADGEKSTKIPRSYPAIAALSLNKVVTADEDTASEDFLQRFTNLSPYASEDVLTAAMEPAEIMRKVWREVVPELEKALEGATPLQLNNEDQAYTAPWSKTNCFQALKGRGRHLASAVITWFDLAEQSPLGCSWRNVLICAQHFWSRPNDNAPHLVGTVDDALSYKTGLPKSKSIKLKGCFELMAGLGIQLRAVIKEGQLSKWSSCLRTLIITVFIPNKTYPAVGVGVKARMDVGVLATATGQPVTAAAEVIMGCIKDIDGNKGIHTPRKNKSQQSKIVMSEAMVGFMKVRVYAPRIFPRS